MFQLAHRPQAPEGYHRSQPDHVRAFLIESERRVILHCRSLLERVSLSDEERRKLTRLASEAEAMLQRLAA